MDDDTDTVDNNNTNLYHPHVLVNNQITLDIFNYK